MEFRVMKYFLAVARTENISRAAEELHVSQPALSRQLMDLEEELGVKLLVRSNRQATLTEAGFLLKKRAEEMFKLMAKTLDEVSNAAKGVSGSVYIGCGETAGMRLIAKAVHELQEKYPRVSYNFRSMDGLTVKEQLKRGILDFGIVIQQESPKDYPCIELPYEDRWGVLMRKDSPLATLPAIRPEDLEHLPLIFSKQSLKWKEFDTWFHKDESQLHIVATYNLLYNATLFAEEGIGYVICFNRLINIPDDSPLIIKPLDPPKSCRVFFIWKKNQTFSEAARLLKEEVLRISERKD